MTEVELAACLAGLRMLQEEIGEYGEDFCHELEHFQAIGPKVSISCGEIDDLCEKLNFDTGE